MYAKIVENFLQVQFKKNSSTPSHNKSHNILSGISAESCLQIKSDTFLLQYQVYFPTNFEFGEQGGKLPSYCSQSKDVTIVISKNVFYHILIIFKNFRWSANGEFYVTLTIIKANKTNIFKSSLYPIQVDTWYQLSQYYQFNNTNTIFRFFYFLFF